jgi:multidrug resistance efflux pump
MLRRIALSLATSAAVCGFAVAMTSAFPANRQSSSSRAADASRSVTQVALRRSGYIVASS